MLSAMLGILCERGKSSVRMRHPHALRERLHHRRPRRHFVPRALELPHLAPHLVGHPRGAEVRQTADRNPLLRVTRSACKTANDKPLVSAPTPAMDYPDLRAGPEEVIRLDDVRDDAELVGHHPFSAKAVRLAGSSIRSSTSYRAMMRSPYSSSWSSSIRKTEPMNVQCEPSQRATKTLGRSRLRIQ